MNKFKIGDRVRYIEPDYTASDGLKMVYGDIYTVSALLPYDGIRLKEFAQSCWWYEYRFESAKEANIKRLLDRIDGRNDLNGIL